MDLLTIFGALLGVAAIAVGFTLEGGHFTALLQPQALVIVLGGTLAAVMIQNTWARFSDGVVQIRLAFVKARQVDRENLTLLLEWGDQAKLNGMLALESIDTQGLNPFAQKGLELLANGLPTAVIEDALQRELDAYERNHMGAARIWQQAGGRRSSVAMDEQPNRRSVRSRSVCNISMARFTPASPAAARPYA